MNLILTLLLIFLSSPLYSQEPPKNIEEFKVAILNFKDPAPKKEYEIPKNLQVYFDNLKKSAASIPMDTSSHKDLSPLYDCIQKSGSFKIENTIDFVNMCKEQWKKISNDQKNYLKSKNILSPDEYLEGIRKEDAAKFRELEEYNKPDQLIVMNDFYVMKEVTPDQIAILQETDPEIKSVSRDVQQILLKMHTSSDPATVAEKLEASKETEELIKLTELIAQLKIERGECSTDQRVLRSSHAEKFVIGLTGDEDLSKLESYKFSQNGKTYYLYKVQDGLLHEQSWIMGHVDENGEMKFRYFQLVKDQPNHIKMATEDDINILKGRLQKTTLEINQNKMYLQMQSGLSVKGSKGNIPLIGTAIIPQNEIVIGKVQMNYLSKKVLVQNDLSVTAGKINFTNETSPSLNNIWSLGSGVEYNPLNGNIRVSGNVRVYDLVVGYTNNLEGNQSGRVSYVLDRNFVQVNSDFKSINASLGQSLPKGKGLIMGTTNFKSFHEVKVILYLQ